jgi:hypothetical protein
VQYNNMLQKVKSLISTNHSMYFHGPNVTALGQGGLQVAYVVERGKGSVRGKGMQRTGTHNPIVTNY